MKKLVLIVLAIIMTACGEAAKVEQDAQARDAAMDAATAKMIVVRGHDIPDHPQYVTLGKVRGHCMQNPEANDTIPNGDNLRQAAYRRYGAQVDGIVDATAFFVNDDYTPVSQPGSSQGHFECEGNAVHFSAGMSY